MSGEFVLTILTQQSQQHNEQHNECPNHRLSDLFLYSDK